MYAEGALGPSFWAVSDGRAGNAAQVRAIMRALGETERWMKIAHIQGKAHHPEPITLNPRAPWVWLPADKWPHIHRALPKAKRETLTPPFPTVWIGAGRRVAAFTRYIHQQSPDTFTIQILDPRISSDNFDLLVTPAHDQVSGDNVISTLGSPSYFSPDDIENAGQAFADLADDRGKSAIVILGGHSRAHSFTTAAAARLEQQLRALAAEGWRLRITASRRTPLPIAASFRTMAEEIGAHYWAGPDDGPNPYLAWLSFSDVAIVTEDSANLLSDAAWHGLPTHIARLEGRADKFDRLHQTFIDYGAARLFGGSLETWSYTPLREAERVADIIVEKLLVRHPQPKQSSSHGLSDFMGS